MFAMHTPFDGKSSEEVLQKTSRGVVDFSTRPIFSVVSNESLNFVLHLLRSNPRDRPKADEAIQDCWLGLKLKMASNESSRKELFHCKDKADKKHSEALVVQELTSDTQVPTPYRRWPAILRNPVSGLLLNTHMPSLPLTHSLMASARAHSTSANSAPMRRQHAEEPQLRIEEPWERETSAASNPTTVSEPLCSVKAPRSARSMTPRFRRMFPRCVNSA